MNIDDHEILGKVNRKEFKEHYGRDARNRGELAIFWIFQQERKNETNNKSVSSNFAVSGSKSSINNCNINVIRRQIGKQKRNGQTIRRMAKD